MMQYNIYALFQVVFFVKYIINVPVESVTCTGLCS